MHRLTSFGHLCASIRRQLCAPKQNTVSDSGMFVSIQSANGGPCEVEVRATFLEDLSYEQFVLDEAHYERILPEAEGDGEAMKPAANSSPSLRDGELVLMCERVAETADNWADCSDMKEALAVFKELGQDCRKLLEKHGEPVQATSYTLNLDGPLFRKQREFLVNLMDRTRNKEATPPQLPADAEEVLEGLISLTDEIADQAHDQYGIDCLLEEGASPKEVAAPRYILYDFDSGDLATTTVYDSYDEAADDASQLDNVIILALRLG